MLGVSLHDPQGVRVSHAAAPALDDNDRVILVEEVQLHRLRDAPLDTLVDVLLPVDLGEVGLRLREQEGVDAAIQVAEPRGCRLPRDHENRAYRPILGDEARRVSRGREDDDGAGVQVEGCPYSSHAI